MEEKTSILKSRDALVLPRNANKNINTPMTYSLGLSCIYERLGYITRILWPLKSTGNPGSLIDAAAIMNTLLPQRLQIS